MKWSAAVPCRISSRVATSRMDRNTTRQCGSTSNDRASDFSMRSGLAEHDVVEVHLAVSPLDRAGHKPESQ